MTTISTTTTPPAIINFARGHPNKSLLPLQEMQEILQKVGRASSSLSVDDDDGERRLEQALNYPMADRGNALLLAELSAFLNRHCQVDDLGSPPSLPHAAAAATTANTTGETTSATTDLFMTHGVSHGLDILCTAQTRAGDVVLMERPTYFLAADIFKSHGLKVDSLPMKNTTTTNNGGGGIDLDRLEQMLERQQQREHLSSLPRMIYIIPTHQNPTGRTMSIQDRWKLAALARRFGILVVADEVYHLLDWRRNDNTSAASADGAAAAAAADSAGSTSDPKRPARMAVVDSLLASTAADSDSTCTSTNIESVFLENRRRRHSKDDDDSAEGSGGCCVSVSSFTKIFAPGVRCGWIEGPKHIIDSLVNVGYICSQGGCVPFVGEVLYTSMTHGYNDAVLAKLQAALQQRSRLLVEILSLEPGIGIDTIPLGGYFVWISFQGVHDTSQLLEYCLKRGVGFLSGSRCNISIRSGNNDNDEHGNVMDNSNDDTDYCQQWARLCFADLDMQQLKEGATLLVSCYRDYLQETKAAVTE
jgi:DNA-binding transcriptional MocR family regulator